MFFQVVDECASIFHRPSSANAVCYLCVLYVISTRVLVTAFPRYSASEINTELLSSSSSSSSSSFYDYPPQCIDRWQDRPTCRTSLRCRSVPVANNPRTSILRGARTRTTSPVRAPWPPRPTCRWTRDTPTPAHTKHFLDFHTSSLLNNGAAAVCSE